MFFRSFIYCIYFFFSQNEYGTLIISALVISILANTRNIPNKNILKRRKK